MTPKSNLAQLSLPDSGKYWSSLSDDQLLTTAFRTDDPARLPGIVQILPNTSDMPVVEFAYNTAGAGIGKVRCIHCKYDNHNRGFVLKFDNGTRMLVGKDCGKKIYGADFDAIEKDFNAARDRADFLKMRLALIAHSSTLKTALANLASHPSIAMFAEARRDFNRAMAGVAASLASAAMTQSGALFVEDRVRDFEAEVKREEKQELLQAQIDKFSKTEIKKLRSTGALPSGARKLRPIYKQVSRQIGTLAGLRFFELREMPAPTIESLNKRVWSSLSALETQRMSNVQLGRFFREFHGMIDDILAVIDRLAAPLDAFEQRNLDLIAQWASSTSGTGEKFIAGKGVLARYDHDVHLLGNCRCPQGYERPAAKIVEAIRATKSLRNQ